MQLVAYHFSNHARCAMRGTACPPSLQFSIAAQGGLVTACAGCQRVLSVAPRANALSTRPCTGPFAKLGLGLITAKALSGQLHENLASHSLPLAPLPKFFFVEETDCLL